jgi:adenylate cyclase
MLVTTVLQSRRAGHVMEGFTQQAVRQEALAESRWPSGQPIQARAGIASGPPVAGVIGRRKFAYDLWSDTVNLASRLESHGEAGKILVADATAERLSDRYSFGPVCLIDLKGPTRALVRATRFGLPHGDRLQIRAF